MNGKVGIVKGFHVNSGRRVVYLLLDRKNAAIKPQNSRVQGELRIPPNCVTL